MVVVDSGLFRHGRAILGMCDCVMSFSEVSIWCVVLVRTEERPPTSKMVPHRTKHEFRGMMGSDENTPFYQKKIHQVRLRTR